MQLVGHVPYNLALIISLFLKRDVNKSLVGEKVNRGAGLASSPGHTQFSMLHAAKGKAWDATSYT